MEIVSLSLLFGLIVVCDQVLNGQFKMSQRVLDWIDRKSERINPQDHSTPES